MKKILLVVAFVILLCSNAFASYSLYSPNGRLVLSGFQGSVAQLSPYANEDFIKIPEYGSYKILVEGTNTVYYMGVSQTGLYNIVNGLNIPNYYERPIINKQPLIYAKGNKIKEVSNTVETYIAPNHSTYSQAIIYSPGVIH